MSTDTPIVINEPNLSHAWGRAFLLLMDRSPKSIAPLLVSIDGFDANRPAEAPSVRKELDQTLELHSKFSCEVTAFTIFPYRLWERNTLTDRSALYKAYLAHVLPRLKARDTLNRHGTYFERMINYQGSRKKGDSFSPESKNQLEDLITVWNRDRSKNRRTRRSALQIACLDPVKDITGSALAGFPCLHQVSFSFDNDDGLAVNAYYPTQYIFDRAYGNYLGLCYLGKFMAHEMGLKLLRLSCFIGQPELGKDITKRDLRKLAALVRDWLAQSSSAPLAPPANPLDVAR